MPKYEVHVYAVVRLTVAEVEATDMQDAIVGAMKVVDYNVLTRQFGSDHPGEPWVRATAYADELVGFTVDVVGDDSYSQTTHFQADGVREL